MKMTKFYAPLAALLLAGAAFTSCSSDDAKSEVVPANKNWSLSIEASAPGLDTRALEYEGVNSSVASYWKLGEKMEVYNVTQGATFRGYLTPKNGGNIKDYLVTTAEGLTGGFAMGDKLRIYYPTKDVKYTGQNGQFETVSEKFDYSSVSVTITAIDEANKALKATSAQGKFAAQFTNMQSLVRFIFKNEDLEPVTVKYVQVSGTNIPEGQQNPVPAIVQMYEPESEQAIMGPIDINVPGGAEADNVWVALRCNANATITVDVTDVNDVQYRATTAAPVQFHPGAFYEIPVTLKQVEEEPEPYGSGSKARN